MKPYIPPTTAFHFCEQLSPFPHFFEPGKKGELLEVKYVIKWELACVRLIDGNLHKMWYYFIPTLIEDIFSLSDV